MKRILPIVFSIILGGTAVATDPRYFNAGNITNALPIDATVFENWGTFTPSFSSEFAYSTRNTLYFTNQGTMAASVGFQIDNVNLNAVPPRGPLTSFVNEYGASISGVDSGITVISFGTGTGGFIGSGGGAASILKISANNLVNHGDLSVGTVGLLQITGKNVDLSRGSVASGQVANSDTNFFGTDVNRGFTIGGLYVNPFGVEDIYWGAGAADINLRNGTFSYFPPTGVRTPPHLVQVRSTVGGLGFGFFQQLLTTLPTTFPAEFAAYANVNQVGTNVEIQVVFLKTNFTDTNITAQVRFGSSSIPVGQTRNQFGRAAIVEFSTPEFDPASRTSITNSIYFIDSSAEQTTLVLLTNGLSVNSEARPSGYEITTATPFEWFFAQAPNTPYDPTMLFPGNTYDEKDTISGFYGGYSAKVGRNPESLSGTTFNNNLFNFGFFGDTILLLPDPTNQAGRVEINADTLDLTSTRIRTEGMLSINAKHLKAGGADDVSAGIINANFASTNGSLVISNIFPTHFKRVRGDLFAWSAIWNNTETNDFVTNNVMFHVLVLDNDLKADFKPTIRNLTLSATKVLVNDDLTINRSARFVASDLTFAGTVSGTNVSTNVLTLVEQARTFGAANMVGVKNFLNESNSVIQGANNAFFGFDTADGFLSLTNRGLISATAPLFKVKRFENAGTIEAINGGSVIIQASSAKLSNGKILADRNISISANDLVLTNSTLTTGQPNLLGNLQFGKLIFDVSSSLSDLGENASNVWEVTDGLAMQRKPTRGDLLGTEIRTIAAGINQQSQVIWAGKDFGPDARGFSNNIALKHLILDIRRSDSSLRFSGTGSANGLYVVTLDFDVGPDVDINTSLNNLLSIDNNLRIYYINSNAGDKLSTAFPGRIVQVPDFTLLMGRSALSVQANGLGIITPNLDGKTLDVGASYKMTAKPGNQQVFAGWTGGTSSPNAALTFKMQRNLVLQANFVPNPFDAVTGVYNGLFHETPDKKHDSSGFITFSVSAKGVVTGKLLLGKSYSFTKQLDGTGNATITVARRGATTLTVNLQVDLAGDTALGTVSDGAWTANFTGDRAQAGTVPAGAYTMIVAGTDTSPGDGFGTFTMSAGGGLKLGGTLTDDTKISQQVNVSKSGKWPLYIPLYSGGGSILGWVNFDPESNTLGGDLVWTKKGAKGFTNSTTAIGSRFTPPASGEPVLDISQGTVQLLDGNLSDPIINEATVQSGTVLITGTNRLSLAISRTTGLLTGSFLPPGAKKTTPVKGVVLQEQNQARGFFNGSTQSGSVLLEDN